MQKIIVTETVEYESIKTYTVFADDYHQAYHLVKKHPTYIGGDLTHWVVKLNIRGTNKFGIIKHSGRKYFE